MLGRISLFVVLVLWSIPALAMPAVLVLAGSYIASNVAGYWLTGVVLMIVGSVWGQAETRKAESEAANAARLAYNSALKERTVTRIATDAPHVYVYGECIVGSSIVAVLTTGDVDQYKHLVCIHAAHECTAIDEVYINDKALGTLNGNGDVTGGDYSVTNTLHTTESHTGTTFTLTHTPVAGSLTLTYLDIQDNTHSMPFTLVGADVTVATSHTFRCVYQYTALTSHVRVKKHLGVANDPADATTISETATSTIKWTSTCTLDGFCYTIVRLDLNQPEFQGGVPSIKVKLRGKKLHDVRSGAYPNDTPSYSTNTTLMIADYLTSEMCNVPWTDLPLAEFQAAANVCDEAITINGASVAKYTANGTVSSDQNQSQVLEKMAQCMAGTLAATTWGIHAGKYVAPVASLSQSDIVGDISYSAGVAEADLYNGVKGQFISSENLYVPTDFTPYRNAAAYAIDGRELWTNIDFMFTNSIQRVWNLSRIYVEDQRNGFTIRASFSYKCWALQVGDRVTFTSAFLGQSSKVYRIISKRYSIDSAVEHTLKEDSAAIWDVAENETADTTPNSYLPNPWVVNKPTQLTCSSGTDILLKLADGTISSRILASWVHSNTANVVNHGIVEIQWQKFGSSTWNKFTVPGDETQTYLSPVEDGSFYTVRIRAVDVYLNAKSDWYYVAHQVIGKTEPPPSMTGLAISGDTLSWTPVVVLDLAGYVFRYHYDNNTDWGSATPLHTGIITDSPYPLAMRPSGVVTIMGKAIDTTGNESLVTANIFTNLGDAPIANIVETITFDPTFAGTLTGCTVSGGDVVADPLDSFYGTGGQSFFGSVGSASFYEPGSYSAMTYHTDDIQISSALTGSVMTLNKSTQGTDVLVEYHYEGQTSLYGLDADTFYGADADSFYDPPGDWMPWPGQIIASNEIFSFRVTIGAGPVQGKIFTMSLTIDAPDMIEYLNDVSIAAAGTAIPYIKSFHSIKTVQATLQANGSGAETVEINKTSPLAPSIKAYNSSHTAVSGATADIQLKGY